MANGLNSNGQHPRGEHGDGDEQPRSPGHKKMIAIPGIAPAANSRKMLPKEHRRSKQRLLRRQKRSARLFALRNEIYKAKTGKSLPSQKKTEKVDDDLPAKPSDNVVSKSVCI